MVFLGSSSCLNVCTQVLSTLLLAMCQRAMRPISLQLAGPSLSGVLSIPGSPWWWYTSLHMCSEGKISYKYALACLIALVAREPDLFLSTGPGLSVWCRTPSTCAGCPTWWWTSYGCCCGIESMSATYYSLFISSKNSGSPATYLVC